MSEPIFKACTRPAMLFSVPMIPLVLAIGIIIQISVIMSLFELGIWWVFAIIPTYFIMRVITKKDDAQFNLLALKFRCRRTNVNRNFYKAAVYSPITFKRRK